jgi:hypothetical protein
MRFTFQILFIAVFLLHSCTGQPQPETKKAYKENKPANTDTARSSRDTAVATIEELLAGTWIHEEDSLARLKISGTQWTLNYVGHPTSLDDIYQLSITNKLAQFVNESVKADFIILTNKSDTVFYEILGLDDSVLSLLHYPTGHRHLYIKSK